MAQANPSKNNRGVLAGIRSNHVYQTITRSDEFSVFLPLLFIVLLTTLFRPDFLSARNFSMMFT